MKNIKVTVVLSTYNQAPYIAQAIESILMQKTNFVYEILASDDASSDGTREIILDYEKKYPSLISHYFTTENIGDCRKFTNCLDAGLLHGEYLAHLEGDDYWLREDRLQILADFLDSHPTYSRVSHRTLIVDEEGNEKGYDMPLDKCDRTFTIESFLAGEQYSSVDSMYRNYYREAGKKYHGILLSSKNLSDFQEMFITQDFGPVYVLSDCLSAYRSRSIQGESNYNSLMNAERRSIDKITVVKAVESFYQGKYDLTPRIFREQKKLITNAVRLQDQTVLQRARNYVSADAMKKILPELLYRVIREKKKGERDFLLKNITAQEKQSMYAGFVSYCLRYWLQRVRKKDAEEKIRGYVVQPHLIRRLGVHYEE